MLDIAQMLKDLNVKKIYSNRKYAAAILYSDGKILPLGNTLYGGDANTVGVDLSQGGFTQVFVLDHGFAALKSATGDLRSSKKKNYNNLQLLIKSTSLKLFTVSPDKISGGFMKLLLSIVLLLFAGSCR